MKKVIVFLLMSFYLNTIAQCVSPTLPVVVSSSSTICSGQSVTLTITSGSLNSATNWQWYTGGCGSTAAGSGTQIVVNPATPTTYFARGEGSCVIPGSCASISVNVLPSPFVVATMTTMATCGNPNGTASVSISGGSPAYTYSWNTPATQATAYATGLAPGVWSVTTTDSQGCNVTVSITTVAAPLPSVTAVSHNILCFGQNNGSATLTASGVGGFTYNWSNFVSASAIANGLGSAIFSATVTDANGCTTFTTINITQPNVLSLTVAPPQTICYGTMGQVYAAANGGTTPYHYTLTNITNNTTNMLVTSAGINSIQTLTLTTTFTASVYDANGCSAGPLSIIVNVRPPLIAVNSTVIACDRDSIVISPNITSVGNGGPYTYNWFNNTSTGNSISVVASLSNTPQNFTVSISDGCTMPSTSAVITVSVSACVGIKENKDSDINISFYPNPANDILVIENDEALEIKLFSVLGKEILHQEITNTKNILDLSSLNNGIYFLSFYRKNEKLRTEKIIVQH